MDDIFAELLKYFHKPSLTKILTALGLLGVGLLAVLCYELYTSSFRLDRLQKAADLFVRLEEIRLHDEQSSRNAAGVHRADCTNNRGHRRKAGESEKSAGPNHIIN